MKEVSIIILIILGVYILGFFISLIFLSKYGKETGWDHYDPPHDHWHDDYSSNASAYTAFSVIWPFFYIIGLCVFLHRKMVQFTQYLINTNKS